MSRAKEIKKLEIEKLGDFGNQKTASNVAEFGGLRLIRRPGLSSIQYYSILKRFVKRVKEIKKLEIKKLRNWAIPFISLFLYFLISLTPVKAATPNFTLSVYLKPSTSIATKAIMIKNNEIRLATDGSGYPFCQISNGTWQTAITSGIAIVVDKWQRVSCAYDGANLRIYVNGNLTGTRAETNVVNDTANLWRFGSDEGGTYGYFSGLMDDVKIYNRALSQREISYLYNQGKPSAEWQFRANYNDTGSWCAENSLCKNLTAGGTGNTFGLGFLEQGATALILNGSGYAYIADDASLDIIDGQDFSISAWVKTSSAGDVAIAAKRNGVASSDTGYLLGLKYGAGAGMPYFEVAGSGANEFSLQGAASIADGTWKNIIAVFDDDNAANCKIFVNGQDISATQTGTLSSVLSLENAVPFAVGAESDYGGIFTGSVDAVRVYKYALTAEDVKKEYNGGAPMRFGARSATTAAAGTDEVGGLPPVAWWKFDEKSGTSAADNSGNGNTGTLGGGTPAAYPTWARGKNGNALSFDGVDDYVDAGNSSIFQFGTGDFTISSWIKVLSIPSTYKAFIQKRTTSILGYEIGVNNSLHIYTSGATKFCSSEVSNQTVNLNQWYHILVTRSNEVGYLYLNGVFISSYANTINASSANNLYFARDFLNSRYGPYVIDDVRIYNYARTARQIAWDFNNGKPSGWWKLDEGTGTSVKDNGGLCQLLSANCHNGTITGADWTTSGKFFNALDFVATNLDYVTIGDTNLNINSVSFWVNADSVTDSFIDLDGGTHKISVSAGAVSASGFATPTYYINGIATASPTITASGWNHILVTTETAFEASNMVLGKIGADYLDGVIDDVRVYGYVRTANDVLTDYNGSSVKF